MPLAIQSESRNEFSFNLSIFLIMSHYNYQKQLLQVWEKAVSLYQDGNRESDTYFNEEDSAFLASIGASAQEVYDFAEDYVQSGEPDFTTFALVQHQRRAYFIERQQGVASSVIINPDNFPAKSDEIRGISWLPRIIPKAKAKLRGELDSDTMYGCGGDRDFMRTHDIHLAEFLSVVWAYENDDEKIIDWVENRSKAQ